MKTLPIHLSADPDALNTATDVLAAPVDSSWLSALALLGDPAAAAPAGAGSDDGAAGLGVVGDQAGDVGLDATALSASGGVVALADAFVFTDSAAPSAAGVDAAATMASFAFAGSAGPFADGGDPGAGVDSFIGDAAASTPVGSGGVVLPASNIEASASGPADILTGVNFPSSPFGLSNGNPGQGVNLSLGANQNVGFIPDLKFAGPDGPEPVVGHVQTGGSSQSSPIESSAAAGAGSGMTISQAVTNANGSTSESVTFAGSGIVFNDTFDAGVSQAYKNCILSAEQTIASQWSNSVTINAEFTTQAEGQNGELAFNEFFTDLVSYSTLKSALTTLASQEPGNSFLQQAVAHLPSADPSKGVGFDLTLPYARMLGLTSTSGSPDDLVTLNTSYNWSYGQDVINTVEHELSEGGLGRVGGLGDQNSFWSVMDLFRYNSSGVADYSDGRDGRTTFFSDNGGATLSALSFNNEFNSSGHQVNGGDTADFVQQDVFGTGNPGETNTLSPTDIQLMDALGWDPHSPPVVTVSNVTLSASQASVAASSLFTAFDPNGDQITEYGFMDTGPGSFVLNTMTEPNNQEIDVTAAQLSQLTYQSALGTIDTLQIRAEDATGWGNWASFTVTAPPLVIQTDTGAFGSTSLTQLANEYFLDNSGGSGPVLKDSAGHAIVAGEVGGWVPIGAVQTASGYEVVWKLPSANEFSIWTTDSNGNDLTASAAALAANSLTLENAELVLNQDLNGDRTIGPPTIVIQTDTGAFGSTSLTQVGSNYFLDNSGGSGPVLKDSAGHAIVAGQVGGWAPIGAVQTASGYEVVWKLPSANEFSIWTTDSNGNDLTASAAALAANSLTLENAELVLNQDLNGDRTIGPPTIVIQTDTGAFGSTSLTQVGDNYFLDNSGGSGPVLKDSAGHAIVAGQVGGWAPIGAVQTASGYEVVWKLPSANEFSIWTTDSNGNDLTASAAALAANSLTLENAELVLNQDLNGDRTIGPPTIVIQTDTGAFGSTSLTQVGDNYFLDNSGGSGPVLKDSAGHAIVAGQVGGWAPIGAVQTASGYEVVWKLPSANEFSIWTTDSNGNDLTASAAALAANSLTLENAELVLNQDLNGDRIIGPPAGSSTAGGATTLAGGVATQALPADTPWFTSLAGHDSGAGSGPPSVAVGGLHNDSFIFKSGFGTIANEPMGGNGVSPLAGFSEPNAGPHQAQNSPLHFLLESAIGGHDTGGGFAGHEPMAAFHASSFAVHPPIIG